MFLSIALIAIKALLSTDFHVDARDLCLSITYEGKCCSIPDSHSYATCWKSGEEFFCNSNKPCSRRFPGFQSAQPLGMASGLIGNNQFVVPDEDLQAKNARRLWNGGWSVLNTYVNSYSGYFTSIGSVYTFPKSILQSSPVFFQIDFIRMKMVRYLLVGVKVDNTNGDRTFALSYRNAEGKSVVYGDTTTPVFVQKLTCSSVEIRRDCRFKVNPFRARSLRIVAINYQKGEKLSFEVGGLDYLEADNQWTLDNVTRTTYDVYYSDERGEFPLKTSQVIPSSYSGPDAGLVTTMSHQFHIEGIGKDHCYANPTKCQDGLSIAFWFKVGGAQFSILATGIGSPSEQHVGFNIRYEDSARMNVILMLTTNKYSLVYNIPKNDWHHFLITWSQVSGLLLYEDGTRVSQGTKETKNHQENFLPKIFVGYGTANNGTQLHDLRFWQFRLSEVDVKNLFSPSKVDAAQLTDYIMKFRPMDCVEAIAAYGNKSATFDLHWAKGSINIRCIPVMNGAKFYFLPITPSVNVSQPWVDGSFEQIFEYDYAMEVMRHFIQRASSCRQTISYSCMLAKITGNSRPCDKDRNNWQVGCEGASCNCDDDSQRIMKYDKQHFIDRNKLPLGRIIINSVSRINSSLTYTVGPVECFQANRIYKSCKDALDKNSQLSGSYRIATTNKIIMVLCEFDSGTYKSVFRHADSGKSIRINGFEEKGSYARQIVYEEDFASIVSIVDASDSCEQKIEAKCQHSIINGYSWFTDRSNNKIQFWAGGQGTGCKCAIDSSCADSSKKCNCDKNDNVNRNDDGSYTDKSLLPLSGVRVGETGGATEYLELKIGDLVCSGNNDVSSSSSLGCSLKLQDGSCVSNPTDDGCTNEVNENGCCTFPFTYRGVSYENCSVVDSKLPWCSLNSTYSGKWRYCITKQAKAHIDFIGNLDMDDFGDWKIGSDCNGEDNSGPCYDMSASSLPSEKVSIVTQQYLAKKLPHSSYSQSSFQCKNNMFQADVKGSLTAMQFELKDMNKPTTLSKAFYKFKIGVTGFTAILHVYSVIDPVGGAQYIEQCRYAHFRTGLHFGPIVWRLEVMTSAQRNVATPDLKEIILPILRSGDITTNQNLYLVFEWKEFIVGDLVKNYQHSFETHMHLEYKEKQPGNYLYADSFDAKRPGTALSYHTKHFPPSKKCLQFWYHMQNVGDGVLIVNLYQKGHTSREILKIVGHQGNSWKKATVPIDSYLKSSGNLFKITFVAIRGTKIHRSIAIDDISFLDDVCILQPQLSYSLADNLPKARLILTLGHTLSDASNSASFVKKLSNPDETTEDPFGYQLLFGAFGNGANRSVASYSEEFKVSADFSLCYHMKAHSGIFFNVFQIYEFFSVSYNSSGFLRVRFRGADTVWMSKQTITNGTWGFVCLVYVQHLEILKVFSDGQLFEEIRIGHISQKIPKKNIFIGPTVDSMRLFLSCVQFYEEALDDDFIPALELCPDRHLKDACKVNCKKGSICNPLTGKCACPSYANRFVAADCGNALESTVYNGHIEYISFDNKTEAPWKFYRSIAEVQNRSKNTSNMASSAKFLLIPGPVNVGLCANSSSETIRPVPTASCLSTGSCSDGSTLSLWILVPPVLNWTTTGNVTLMKYGKLEISCGLVNDRRNGTTKPIPSLMFSVAQSGEKCLWVSMIYGSMVTNAWTHIVVTIDATNSVRVYYNGQENDIKKASCQSHASQGVFAFSSGSLPFTCMDELVLWNHVLLPEVVEYIYNVTTFGGNQAVHSKIDFRRLVAREPDDLWAIDQSNTLYKYHNAAWVPIPEMKIREVASGGTGFFAISWNNSLWRREGISPQNPIGTRWQSISTSIMLKGAITDIQTVTNGHLHAKSAYQWHCIKVASTDDVKTVTEITNVAYGQLSCSLLKCWSMKKNAEDFIAAEMSAKGDCTMGNLPQSFAEPTIKRIGSSFNAGGPLAIRKSDGQLLESILVLSGTWKYEWLASNSKTKLTDVIGLNGQAVGVTSDGKIEFIKRSNDAFLIKPSGIQNVCLRLEGDRFRFKISCTNLFALRKDLCMLHLETNRILQFKNDKIGLRDFCSDDDKVILNKDGTIRTRSSLNCVIGCTTDHCDPKLSNSPTPQEQCIVFLFVKAGSVKTIPSHNLIWNATNLTQADVKVDMKVTFHLHYPRWTDQLAQPYGKQFQFFCKKVENEMQQLFAGNINYKNLECQKFEKTKCSSVVTERCQYSMYVRLSFAHIDEDTRVLLYSRKLADEMTDCNGLVCTITLMRKAVGVDFNPHGIEILKETPSAATIQIQSSDTSIVAEAGYRISAVGKSAYENNLRTMYMEFVSRDGNMISVNNAASYFNYSCEAVPLFVQGSGYAAPFSFQTREDVPSISPVINVTASQRNRLEVTLTEIPTTTWNGVPLGYRVYYQPVLKLKHPGNLEMPYVTSTYNHINFTVNVNFTERGNFSYPIILKNLEVFSNYSILAAAYSGAGVGPFTQVFWRTNQGEPEVPPHDFQVNALNSTHLKARWSMTDDIELLNGWFVSNYSVKYQESSIPSLAANGSLVVRRNQFSVIIGPLDPWREYTVSVAGNVESRPGVFASLCVRTDEDVPTEPPNISKVGSVTASTINYTTGCLHLSNEHGEILYYNISATRVSSSQPPAFYLANITPEKCIAGSSCFPGSNDSCPLSGGSKHSPESYIVSHNCSSNRTKMSRTSSLVYHVLDQLNYWTIYDIRAAACTRKGCGPFSSPLSTRTDEHPPTCYPNATAVQNTSSTSLRISWSQIPISCAHGTVLHYNIFVSPANELTYDECFNDTSCWPQYSPGATKFYVKTEDLSSEFTGLKKYWRYCIFLQAVNIKGRGPSSYSVCNYTAEDEPEGPPASFNVTTNSSRSLLVKLETPSPDIVNGIIRGYHVFYHMTDKDGKAIGNEMMADIKRTNEKATLGLVDNLEEFTWYRVTARAYTSIGYGPNTTDFKLVRTLEDVPSGPPRNQEVTNIQSDSFKVKLDEPLPLDLNGIFTEFKISLIENCRNGTVFEYEFYTVASNVSVEEVTEGNNTSKNGSSGSFPVSRRRRGIPQNAANEASNQVGNTANGAQGVQNTVQNTVNGVGNQVQNTANGALDGVQNIVNNTLNNVGNIVNGSNSNIFQSLSSKNKSSAIAHMNLTDLKLGLTNRASFDFRYTSFDILISGLLPYTFYNISIAACNKIGCGPLAHLRERTDQTVPSGVPQPHLEANKTLDSLFVSWSEVPIMKRRGVVTGYMVKWMKNCEYLRLMNFPEIEDCRRVIPENTTNFVTKEVGSSQGNTLVNGLDPYTWYRFEFCAKTVKGYGPCSNITYQTDETTPCEAPNVTSTIPVTGKSFQIEWDDVAMPCQRGIIIGYMLFYQLTSLLQNENSTGVYYESTNTTEKSILIDDLALKSNFSVKIAAYTSKGVGVNSSIFYAMTGDFKHGNWSEWSQWTYCSESCGGGINIRYRKCDNPAPFNGGDYCTGSGNDTKPCNQFRCSGPLIGNVSQNCAVACKTFNMICSSSFPLTDPLKMYAAEGWPCVDSTSDPIYSKLYHPSYDKSTAKCEGFRDMPPLINCTQQPPNDGKTMRLCNCVSLSDCGCQEWAEWSLCSKAKCGGGTKTRKRECTSLHCGSSLTSQKTECNTNPCPIDGSWGQWSDITPCNKSCGYGYRHRYRECNDPAPNYGGKYCRGTHVDVIPECNVQQCPVHGKWGNWGEWRVCNKVCGGGSAIRRRYCDNPAPKYNGKYCKGGDSQGVPCNMHECEGIRVRFAVKLVDFDWNFYLVYNNHPETVQIAETTRLNVRAVYNYSSIISAVDVLNFVKGSVVANFTIYYVQVSDSQVLLLQDYITATGKMNNLSTVFQEAKPMEVVADPPHSLKAQSFSHNTMIISWQPPNNVNQIGNLSGYYIFYREKDGPVGKWNAEGVPMLNSTSFLLRDLKAFTSYRIRMTLAVKTGNGPASEEVVNKTIEGIPSAAPKNLVITAIKPSQLYVQWTGIEYSEFNGRQFGYVVRYKPYFASQFIEKKVPLEMLETYIYDLKPFTLYTLEVVAHSGGGYGQPVVGNIKTPEGAPSVSPGSFKVREGFSTSKLEVSWTAISDDAANGILLGYKLRYTVTHVSGQPVVGAHTSREFLLDKFTLFYAFTGLQSYTTYSVSVSGYTGGGEGPDTTPISATTCKCPPNILANWYPNPPYVSKGVGLTMSGFMPGLIFDMIASSCGKCENRASEVFHFKSLSGESPMKSSQGMVKKAIGNEYHISYPIFGSSNIRNYMDKHIFILFVQSAGSATVVKNEVDHSSTTMNVFYSIINIWPMYLVVVCLTSLVGIFIWFTERRENEEFSRGNYIFGIFQGFWWAFISMTTVGYGDITPRTFKGRVVAILWTLAGLVLTGILTGSLTSSVTSLTIPPTATLYNTQSAAINNSFEYNLAVRRNSRVNSKRNYETNEQVLNAVRDKEVKIALLDGFTVAGMAKEIAAKKLKISGIINSNNGYGIVLSNEFVRMEQEFRSFIASRQEMISSFKANMTAKLQNAQSSEVDQIPLLFDPSTSIFWDMIYGECIMIAIFSALGIAFSFYRSKKRKNKVLSKAAAYLLQLELVDAMVTEFQEDLRDKLDSIAKKHGSETAELCRIKLSYQRLLKRYQVADRLGDQPKKDDFFNMKTMAIGDSTA